MDFTLRDVVGDVPSYVSANEFSRASHGVKTGALIYFSIPTFVPVDVAEDFVLMCNYTGKEVVDDKFRR